jgi:hypothetical protein
MTTVRLDNDTCGEVIEAPGGIAEGAIVKVKLHDENGNPITQLGYIKEIFD